ADPLARGRRSRPCLHLSRRGELGALAARSRDLPVRRFFAGVLLHVKWFTDPRPHPTQYGLLLSGPVIAAFPVAIGAAGVADLIQHRVPEPKAIRSLERYAKTGSLALRVALCVAMIAPA